MAVYEMNILQTLSFMYLCKNGNTPSVFKHIYTLKPINKYITRSKNILFKPLCKKNFAKVKLSCGGPHLWNKFIAPNNDPLEAATIHIRLKKITFASTNILEDFWNYFHINWNLLNSTQGRSYEQFRYDMQFSVISRRSFFEFPRFCASCKVILVLFHMTNIA